MKKSRLGSPTGQVSVCKFSSSTAKSAAIKSFLEKHGDDLPASVIKEGLCV